MNTPLNNNHPENKLEITNQVFTICTIQLAGRVAKMGCILNPICYSTQLDINAESTTSQLLTTNFEIVVSLRLADVPTNFLEDILWTGLEGFADSVVINVTC